MGRVVRSTPWVLRLAGLGLVGALFSCGEPEPPGPRIDGVTPETLVRGEATPFVVLGEFHPDVEVSFARSSDSYADPGFALQVGDVRLRQVRWLDAARLDAVLAADESEGLQLGDVAIGVTDPWGRTVRREQALEMVDSRQTPLVQGVQTER